MGCRAQVLLFAVRLIELRFNRFCGLAHACFLFVSIETSIRRREQIFCAFPVFWKGGQTIVQAQSHLRSQRLGALLKRLSNSLGQSVTVLALRLGQQQSKLIASNTESIVRAADTLA